MFLKKIMRSASPLFRKLQKLLDRMSTVLLENITGVRVVRAFNKEAHEQNRLNTSFSGYADTSIKANRMFASLDGLSFFTVNVFVILVYSFSGFRVTAGAFAVADIAAIIEYAMLALFYLMMAQMVILTLPRAFECADRVRTVLEFSPTIQDLTQKKVWFPASPAHVVQFQNVAFRFADSEEYTLKNLSFSCRRGETTAIIGGTGSGKSTVASLILRFNDVTDGALLLNGIDLRKMPQEQLRDHIAYVQQRAWLFAGTIRGNLQYSNPNASDEVLWHALEVAQAADFVRSLPDGLDAFVAQGGTNFSADRNNAFLLPALSSNVRIFISLTIVSPRSISRRTQHCEENLPKKRETPLSSSLPSASAPFAMHNRSSFCTKASRSASAHTTNF